MPSSGTNSITILKEERSTKHDKKKKKKKAKKKIMTRKVR